MTRRHEPEIERIDRLIVAAWPLALAGSLRAVRRILKLLDRRAMLAGASPLGFERPDDPT